MIEIKEQLVKELKERPELLKCEDIMDTMGLSKRSAYRFINNAKLKDGRSILIKIGGNVRALKWAVIEWLLEQIDEQNKEGGEQETTSEAAASAQFK